MKSIWVILKNITKMNYVIDPVYYCLARVFNNLHQLFEDMEAFQVQIKTYNKDEKIDKLESA